MGKWGLRWKNTMIIIIFEPSLALVKSTKINSCIIFRNPTGHASDVARVHCGLVQETFLRPRQQKLQSLK